MPSRADFSASAGPIIRGTALGSLTRSAAGGGALLSSLVLRVRKTSFQDSRTIWSRRHRRCRRPRGSEQRRRADIVHTDADSGIRPML
jgi:hypothetical protein